MKALGSILGGLLLALALVSQASAVDLTPVIRLNSVGFLPDQTKQASLTVATTNFSVIRRADKSVAYTGTVSTARTNADTGESLFLADFSTVKEAGIFYLLLPNGEVSAPFCINPRVYHEAFRTTMLGMYLWRCGTAVSATEFGPERRGGGEFSHDVCHTNDAWLDHAGATNTHRPSPGGWHDAGDYNKYVVNAGVTVGCMFRAWEDFGPAISRIKLGLPGPPIAMPQFLKELKWELDWLLTMQAEDGSVHHKVSTLKFGGFVMPEAETAKRYFTPWSSAATASFVAMLAQAARNLREFDAAYADHCLAAARKSYAFLQAHLENHAADQSAFSTGGYPSRDEDDRLWAAAELWETTGDTNALRDFEQRAAGFSKKLDQTFDWGNVKNLGMLTYLFSQLPGRDPALVKQVREDLLATADQIVATRDAHGYARPLGTMYHWGGNGSVARQTVLLQAAFKISRKPEYRQTALDALGYLFGRNYYGRSFVTGVGENPPLHPHDRRSGADSVFAPWPGYLVGGPQRRATDWKDEQGDYRTNEIAINWNGALIYALAGFLDGAGR